MVSEKRPELIKKINGVARMLFRQRTDDLETEAYPEDTMRAKVKVQVAKEQP